MPTGSVPLEDLFVPRFTTGWLLVFVYFPMGIALMVVRMFMGLQLLLAVYLLPHDTFLRRVALRVMLFIMGMVVREEDKHKIKRPCIYVANQISPLDHFAVKLSSDCVTMRRDDHYWALDYALGCKKMGLQREELGSFMSNNPSHSVLVFPEERPTSGKTGLLKFESSAFSTGFPVQPVLVRAWRSPVPALSLSTLGSHPLVDLLVFLFVPITIYNLKYMDVIAPEKEESCENFGRRVQQRMCSELQVTATSYTNSDIAEMYKKKTAPPPPPSHNRSSTLYNMAYRVKEVLPTVPIEAILKDIKRTRDVEQTISNVLEGNIPYTPEPLPETSEKQKPAPPSLNTGASKFATSATERMKSYQERKEKLIENARRRYLEKHPPQSS